jgi:hypothetical protein
MHARRTGLRRKLLLSSRTKLLVRGVLPVFLLACCPGIGSAQQDTGAAAQAQENARAQRLNTYLRAKFPNQIESVSVDDTQVRIEGRIAGEDSSGWYLDEIPMDRDSADMAERDGFSKPTPISPMHHRFSIILPRYQTGAGIHPGRPESSEAHDRLLSRWAIVVRKPASGYRLASHAHYTGQVKARWDTPAASVMCKKGLGPVTADDPLSDLDQLGICSITVNVVLSFLHSRGSPADIQFSYHGRNYFADASEIAQYDRVLQYAARQNIIVAAIILVPKPGGFPDAGIGRLMAYPGTNVAASYAMPNLTSAAGVETYAAALDFLAARYSRPDRKYGRIDDWIMHNEVDQGWVWADAGEKPEITYLELCDRSMRIMYLLARQYNAKAKVFISLTHFWTVAEDANSYRPHQMLTDLVRFSHAEGDYEWGIAYHPYPASLVNPRTWDDQNATFSMDTPLITFRNIEVLNAWAREPANLYPGTTHRTIFLSEQGFNSPDYSAKSLTEQEAALAYAWKKIKPLDAIEGMQYHNWIDNKDEDGLRIGLRKFPEDRSDPRGRKPAWYLYRKLGTPQEDQAAAFALPIIGVRQWSEVLHAGPIAGAPLDKPAAVGVKNASSEHAATHELQQLQPDRLTNSKPYPRHIPDTIPEPLAGRILDPLARPIMPTFSKRYACPALAPGVRAHLYLGLTQRLSCSFAGLQHAALFLVWKPGLVCDHGCVRTPIC